MKKLLLILLCLPMIGFGQCISGDCENGYGTYTYDLGNWKSRQGGSIHSMVSQYVGQWKDGKYHGKGKFTSSDGSTYTGEYQNGLYHGKGKYNSKFNGDQYEGEYKNGKKEGVGIYIYGSKSRNKGDKYAGGYKHNNFHGKGTYIWANGDKYVGSFEKNTRNGFGEIILANGDKYVGQFYGGRIEGVGTYTWDNGDVYDGQLRYYKREGGGIMLYKDGSKYIGEWESGKKEGQGTFSNSEGVIEEGMWENDKLKEALDSIIEDKCISGNCNKGKGTYTYSGDSGGKYVGEWKNRERNGYGMFIYSDGSMYVGKWRNDIVNGQGFWVSKDGSYVSKGLFLNGIFTEEISDAPISEVVDSEDEGEKIIEERIIEMSKFRDTKVLKNMEKYMSGLSSKLEEQNKKINISEENIKKNQDHLAKFKNEIGEKKIDKIYKKLEKGKNLKDKELVVKNNIDYFQAAISNAERNIGNAKNNIESINKDKFTIQSEIDSVKIKPAYVASKDYGDSYYTSVYFTLDKNGNKELYVKDVIIEDEEMPSFKSCKAGDEKCTENEIMSFVLEFLKYPETAIDKNITGRVFVEMVVDKQGKVTKVRLVPGSEGFSHENLEQEALRVVKTLPDFRPGMLVRYTIPINFNLD